MTKTTAETTWGVRTWDFLSGELNALANKDAGVELVINASKAALDTTTLSLLDKVLEKYASYRDGLLIQTAFAITATEEFDIRHRQEGARAVAQKLGALLASLHIKSVKDAYQNIGKNSTNLVRKNVLEFDQILTMANKFDRSKIRSVFNYVAASACMSARPISPMPRLNMTDLTFTRTVLLVNALLDTPSGGVFEQYLLAAFIHGELEEYGLTNRNGLYVETKDINASDASSGTAADVQVMRGNRIEEAFEITANDWSLKPAAAIAAMREHDLSRIHIVASVKSASVSGHEITAALPRDADVSVLDLRALLHALVAFMHKPSRVASLQRFYELLDRKQGDIAKTNTYVALLHSHNLTSGN